MLCTNACLTDALQKSDRQVSLEELNKIIQRDRQFWGSEGGLTLSGGEPLYQFDFALQVLKKAHSSYIHTAIETCGHIKWTHYEQVLPYLDWIFFDLKHLDSAKHKEETGQDNYLILENAQRIAEKFKGRMVFRTPIISGYNDSDDHIDKLANFILKTSIREINILPLHLLGRDKYRLLGYDDISVKYRDIPSEDQMQKIADKLDSYGLKSYVGSETDF